MIVQELGSPTWISALMHRIRQRGPARASGAQWLKFLLACTEHGIGKDEIEFSGVAHTLLKQHGEHDVLTRRQVLAAVALDPVMPRLQLIMDDSFRPSGEWAESAVRVDPKHYIKHALFGKWPASSYVKRYRHRSLGWSVVLARHADLMHADRKWWLVLDPSGVRVVDQPTYGFSSAPDAMAHAMLQVQRRFKKSALARHAPRWERYSMHGLGPYAELLITLPGMTSSFYSPVHFPGVRNLLVHLRTNVCDAEDGRRVLFLDEVQSDWQACVAGERAAEGSETEGRAGVPFSRDWPLLALKFALWWAGQRGLNGVAWSTPDLHLKRWRMHGPPTEVYRHGLPEAAAKLSRVLALELSRVGLKRLRVRPTDETPHRWNVLNAEDIPVCRPFDDREQAARFANMIDAVTWYEVPVLWLNLSRPLRQVPLFGVGDAAMWIDEPRPAQDGRRSTHESTAT